MAESIYLGQSHHQGNASQARHSHIIVSQVLQGRNKAVYHPMTDCGDHVVVINSKHIALLGREWQYRVYYHHTGYPASFKHMGRHNGKLWIPAWQLHDRDPTLILWKAVYNNMENNIMRKNAIARLHIFPEEDVPEDIITNVTAQIPQLRQVPKSLNDYSEEEKAKFPPVFQPADNFVRK